LKTSASVERAGKKVKGKLWEERRDWRLLIIEPIYK
jgi:hypothetical protein